MHSSASAQNAAIAADEGVGTSSSKLEDIVVVGRKRVRSEQLQKTPIAVTAMSATQLQQPGIKTLVDIGRMAPGASLQASSQRGVQNFAIRGMGVSGTTVSDEPAVGIFQDGVYWGSNYGAIGDTFDLEGVEILRGPQGTLFGRNVTGGGVTLRSARPSQTASYRVMLGVGNGTMFEGSAVANGPLIPDVLAARLAVLGRSNNGVFHNTVKNGSWGETNTYIVRPSIKWTPSSSLDVTLLGEYYDTHGDPVAVRAVAPRTAPGSPPTLAELSGYRSPADFFSVSPNDPGYSNVKIYFTMLEANLSVGPGILTSITGYRKVRSRSLYDADGAPVNGFLHYVATDQHQWSSELRYAADFTDWLGATMGLYYFDQKVDYGETRDLNNHTVLTATAATLDNNSYAAFAEADIKPIEGLSITVGGRYTHERKEAASAPFGQCNFALTTCTFIRPPAYKGNNFSPKVGVSFQVDPTILVYASATKGFRSGGFSLRGTAIGTPYRPEKVTAYEAGFKSDLFDKRARLNVSVYDNKYDDLQRTVIGVDPILGVVQSVFNAADATIKGAEVELTVIPASGLTLAGSYGYTRARYKRFTGFANPQALRFVRVPTSTINLSADYKAEMGGGDHVDLHVGGNYSGRYFYNDNNTLFQKAYWLVDASIGYTTSSGLTVTAYSRNLTNTKYATWGATLGALAQNQFLGEPRTYGIRLTADF